MLFASAKTIQYRFLNSPTIRINVENIVLEVKESSCKECGDTTDCRVWVHEGTEYSEPPKEMILNAILKAVYDNSGIIKPSVEKYELPENLKRFFGGLEN